jgi:hypothetical protein
MLGIVWSTIMKKLVVICLLFATTASASPRFTCQVTGPCFCMASTYFSRSDNRITVSYINFRTGEKKFYDSVTQAEWAAANRAPQDRLEAPP